MGFRVTEALLHPEVLWPALSTSMLMVGARVVPALFTVALVVTAAVLWMRWRAGSKSGLARKARPGAAAGQGDRRQGEEPAPEPGRPGE